MAARSTQLVTCSFRFTPRALAVVSVKSIDPSKLDQDNLLAATVSVLGGTFSEQLNVSKSLYERQGRRESLEHQLRFLRDLSSQAPWTMQIRVLDPDNFQLGLDIQVKQGEYQNTVLALREFTCRPNTRDSKKFDFIVDRVATGPTIRHAMGLAVERLQPVQLLLEANRTALEGHGDELHDAASALDRAAVLIEEGAAAIQETAAKVGEAAEEGAEALAWEFGAFEVTQKE